MKKLIIALFLALSAQLPAQVQMFFEPDTYSGVENPHDVDSLFYWFAADIGVLDSVGSPIANDDGVGTWPDLSGRGHNTTQGTTANRPTWKLNGGPNNRPAVSFDGTNDFLASAAHLWESDDITVFVVMKFGNATRNAGEQVLTRFESPTNERQWNWFFYDAPTSYIGEFRPQRDGGGVNYVTNRFSSKSSSYQLRHFSSNGSGTYSAHINGSSTAVTTSIAATGNHTIADFIIPFAIGASNTASTPTGFLLGSISEIIVYSRALTAGERESIEAYLNQKYKLY